MPSGALMIEQGRPLRCSIIQPPTLSKYFARSSLVIAPCSLVGPQDLIRPTESNSHDDTVGGSVGRGPCALGGRVGAGSAISVLSDGAGVSASTSLAGLSWRRPLNAACRIMPAPVNPANSISATSSGFNQCIPAFLRGASLPPNGFCLRRSGLELRHQARDLLGSVARSDIADVDQVVAAIHAGHQRSELAAIAVPATDDHLMSGAALGLGPGVGSPGSITGGGLLRDNPLQRHPAGGFEDRFTTALEMLDVADFGLVLSVCLFDQLLQSLLAVGKALLPQVLSL